MQTAAYAGPSPSYNEMIQIDIENERLPLVIGIFDVGSRSMLLQHQLSLDTIRQPSFPLGGTYFAKENDFGPLVSVKIELLEQDVPRLERLIEQKKHEIAESVALKHQIQMYVSQLSTPFGFLTKEIKELDDSAKEKEGRELHEEKRGDHKWF